MRAKAYMELGEWDAAITDLNQMIEQDPLAYQAYLKLPQRRIGVSGVTILRMKTISPERVSRKGCRVDLARGRTGGCSPGNDNDWWRLRPK